MASAKEMIFVIGLILLGYVISRLLNSKGKGAGVLRTLFGRLPGDARRETGETAKTDPESKAPLQTNGSKKDILDLVSILATVARRQKGTLIYPGVLMDGKETSSLIGILLTRSGVYGINAFGFGGRVFGNGGGKAWTQVMNGKRKSIQNPLTKSEQQREILERIVSKVGVGEVPVEVFTVFTSPSVQIGGVDADKCYTPQSLREELLKEAYGKDGPIRVKETQKKLKALSPQGNP